MTFLDILHEELGDKVGLEDRIDDVAVDSLDYLSFIKRLEEEFHVQISETQLGTVDTFEQLEELTDGLPRNA